MFRYLILLLIISPLSVNAQPLSDWKPDQVGPNSYVIHGPLGRPSVENHGFMNNPGFILTANGVVVIDPGGSLQIGAMVLSKIKILTSNPVIAVINTHIHGDHWLGNHAIRNAYPAVPIYGHQNMLDMIKAGEGETWRKTMLNLTKGATKGTQVIGPNISVTGSQQLEIDELAINLLFHPKAHSNSDLMVEVPSEDLLFLGDNVLSGRLGQMTHATFKGSIEAIDLALQSSVKRFVPGHGQTADKSIVKTYRQYLVTIREQVALLLDDGLSDFEMKPLIRKAVASYANWVGFEGEFGRHISLAYLEVEEEMF